MTEPKLIVEPNISVAWARAFLALYDREISQTTPIVISAGGFDSGNVTEVSEIRQSVDSTLPVTNNLSCKMNASLIFPEAIWQQKQPSGRQELYRYYKENYYPRLKSRDPRRNGKGTYFLRMIAWEFPSRCLTDIEPKNQLEHIIELYNEGTRRNQRPRSAALQMALFDPRRDQTKAVRSIFPCLQQIGFVYESDNRLTLNAFYPSQYILDRGYGNYLGLAHLGLFVARETGLTFDRLTCFIGSPRLGDTPKSSLLQMSESIRSFLNGTIAIEEHS